VWKLEHQYWENVKALDLVSYRALWHTDFLGWPWMSAQPVRKDHITGWITAYTAKGQRLSSYTLEPAASHATGNIAVVYYWLTSDWVDKNGGETRGKMRVTHTWIHDADGWKILGGMSSVEGGVSQ
jgi:ketosteroid isomerase-like protein